MNRRETILATAVGTIVVGWVLLAWVIDPVLAAFDEVDEQTRELEQELSTARALVDSEQAIRERWGGYQQAGLSRTVGEADAQTAGALLAWAEDAGFEQTTLSDGRVREDDEQPFAALNYSLQTSGRLEQVCDLLWAIHRAPFPLQIEKCVVDMRNDQSDELQLSLAVSTLVSTDPEASPADPDAAPWQPSQADRSAYRDIVAYNIFRADRRRIAEQANPDRNPPETRPSEPEQAAEKDPPHPDTTWRLTGISHAPDGSVAYIEHTDTGELSRLAGPGQISDGQITTIGYDAVIYVIDDEQRVIHVGETLMGERAQRDGSPSTKPRRSAGKDASVQERLRALRERRARELGESPPDQPQGDGDGEGQPEEADNPEDGRDDQADRFNEDDIDNDDSANDNADNEADDNEADDLDEDDTPPRTPRGDDDDADNQ